MKTEQIAVSPCSNPDMSLDDVLRAYSSLGYSRFEVFTSWTKSAFDYRADPEQYLRKGQRFSMKFTSLHLPSITAQNPDSLDEAVCAARFAARIGVKVVLYKAADRYMRHQMAFAPPNQQ